MPHTATPFLILFCLACFLTACGSDDEATATGASDVATDSSSGQDTSTQTAARDCPAQVTSGERPDGMPVDDVVGVRQGMSFEDVRWLLECRDDVSMIEEGEKWQIKRTYDFPVRQLIRASNGTPCSGQEIANDMGSVGSRQCQSAGRNFKALKDITHEIIVVFNGMPGEEKVGAIWRRHAFADGDQPTIESLVASLTTKYGKPHSSYEQRGITVYSWQYDPLGRPMSEGGTRQGCINAIRPESTGSQRWSTACGLTIRAKITPLGTNNLLAAEMHMATMHQKKFYDAGERFEKNLTAAYEARKRQEAADADSGVSTPDL